MTADLQLCSASSTYPEANLQLYSITPVSCQARCKVWKGSLNLKEGTRQIVKGYFDAPGKHLLLILAHLMSEICAHSSDHSTPDLCCALVIHVR